MRRRKSRVNDDYVVSITDKGKEYFAELCSKWVTQRKLSEREMCDLLVLSVFIMKSELSKIPLSPLFKYGYFNLQDLINDVLRCYRNQRLKR